jgi:hypothetical protein
MEKLPTADEIKKEIASIEEQLKCLHQRRELLLKFCELGNQVMAKQLVITRSVIGESKHGNGNGHQRVSVTLAERILSEIGPLTVHGLVLKMMENGWNDSSANRVHRWDKVRSMLRHHDEIFEKHGRGLWDVKPEKRSSERRRFVPGSSP